MVEPGRSLVEVVGTYRRRLLLVGEHARRLAESARATGIRPETDAEWIEQRIEHEWSEFRQDEANALVVLSSAGLEVGGMIACRHLPLGAELGTRDRDVLAQGVVLETRPLEREPEFVKGLRPKWLDRARARPERRVLEHRPDEGLFVRASGEVVGAAWSNVFLVLGDVLVTPSIESGAFPGITRAAVLCAAGDLGLSVEQRVVTSADVEGAADAFLTSSHEGVISVRAIDGRELPPPPPGSRWRRLVPQLRLRVHELSLARLLPKG